MIDTVRWKQVYKWGFSNLNGNNRNVQYPFLIVPWISKDRVLYSVHTDFSTGDLLITQTHLLQCDCLFMIDQEKGLKTQDKWYVSLNTASQIWTSKKLETLVNHIPCPNIN